MEGRCASQEGKVHSMIFQKITQLQTWTLFDGCIRVYHKLFSNTANSPCLYIDSFSCFLLITNNEMGIFVHRSDIFCYVFYIHEGYWLIVFFSCTVLAWFGCENYAGLIDCFGKCSLLCIFWKILCKLGIISILNVGKFSSEAIWAGSFLCARF